MKKNNESPLSLIVMELSHNANVSHAQFRRLIQLALLPNNGKPSSIANKIAKLTGENNTAISQTFLSLEKASLIKRIDGTKGAYTVNANKDEWFVNEPSEAEKSLKKDLDTLEQMRNEILERIKASKNSQTKASFTVNKQR
jgi:uncharacterized surface protein with fasciclin (FAS1) repeats